MVKLIAKPALPHGSVTIGSVTITPQTAVQTTSIAPFRDLGADVASRVHSATGLAWPEPGRQTTQEGARLLWAGRSHVLMIGVAAPDLAGLAAVTDQTAAEAIVTISGPGAQDVLARLVPLDLRDATFATDVTARSQIAHMTGGITRLTTDTYELRVMRSMATTLWHDVIRAATLVSARQ